MHLHEKVLVHHCGGAGSFAKALTWMGVEQSARKAPGKETHMEVASSTEITQKVPERSQMGADVFANPVARNLAQCGQGESQLPAQEKQALCFPRGLAGESTLCCQCPPDPQLSCHTGQRGPQETGTAMSSSTRKNSKAFHLSAKS